MDKSNGCIILSSVGSSIIQFFALRQLISNSIESRMFFYSLLSYNICFAYDERFSIL